jgi:hypothetical protein
LNSAANNRTSRPFSNGEAVEKFSGGCASVSYLGIYGGKTVAGGIL